MKSRKKFKVERIAAGGFLAAILLGSLLLSLPAAAADGQATPYIDALFTATTSICVTGLVTVTTALNWSVTGKIIITCLIQLGGLGIVSFITVLFMMLHRRIDLDKRRMIQESYNLDHMKGVVSIVKKTVIGTLVVEGAGALIYMIQFIPEFGFWKGVGASVFNSVSAFCNAGMDIIGADSLAGYISNPLVNFTTMALIFLGGIGFTVWWDVIRAGKMVGKRKSHPKDMWGKLELHSKLALSISVFLIIAGTLAILVFDFNHAGSLKELSWPDKIMASMFQSVSTRTAGFQTIAQDGFTDASSHVSIILMFIGGSPMGTAGGMKTTTVGIALFLIFAFMHGKSEVVVYKRRIEQYNIRTAFVVIAMGFLITLTAITLLIAAADVDYLDAVFEIVSAIGTVGLTRGITPHLPVAGKLIAIIVMYLGRIGPVTLAIALTRKSKGADDRIQYPEKRILIG